MNNFPFEIVFDLSAFIWDRKDFENNKSKYYDFQINLISFIRCIETYKPRILLRQELLDEIRAYIPYQFIKSDLTRKLNGFLTNISGLITFYDDKKLENIYSLPNIIKDFFKISTKVEIVVLLSEIHIRKKEIAFITFTEFWDNESIELKTICNKTKIHKTIIHNRSNILIDFFEHNKPVFNPNPKHDRRKGHKTHKGLKVSKLSCFDGKDTSYPQQLLDTAIAEGQYLYNFDNKNDVFVRFENNLQNQYSGFDIEIQETPQRIRRQFIK